LCAVLFLSKLFSLDLAPYIRDLILLNECVILRGVGGFETTYKQAKLDRSRNTIAPPSKRIIFHPEWIQDNRVLEEHLTKMLGISREEASDQVDRFSHEFYQKLKTEGTVLLEGIGEFRFNERSVVQFTELDQTNYLADSFGLEVLDIIPVAEIQPATQPEELQPVTLSGRKLTGWYVTIGVLVLVVAVTLIILLSQQQQMSNLGWPWSGKTTTADEVWVLGSADTLVSDTVLQSIENSLDRQTTPQHALALPSTEQVKDGSVSEANYLLIAGSFKNNRNAELLRDQLIRKGFKAEVRETGINFRVIIGQFADRQQAIQELRRMRSQLDQSVWLLEENLK